MQQQPVIDDGDTLPPIKFPSASEAVRWAYEVTMQPDVVSPTQVVLSALRRVPGRGASQWRREDFRDLAYTIMTCVTMIPDRTAQAAYRQTHCDHNIERVDDVASTLAQRVSCPAAQKRTHGQLVRVAQTTVLRERSRVWWPKPMGLAWYARALNMRRQSLYSGGWMDVIKDMEARYAEWVERAETDMAEMLRDKGVMR